jgi:hypothetical protein
MNQLAQGRKEIWNRFRVSRLQEAILLKGLSSPNHLARLSEVRSEFYGTKPAPRSREYTSQVSNISLSVGRLVQRGLVRRVDARRYPAIHELTSKGLEMARQLDELHRRPVQLRLIDVS